LAALRHPEGGCWNSAHVVVESAKIESPESGGAAARLIMLTKFECIRPGSSFDNTATIDNTCRNLPSGNTRCGRAAGHDCCVPAFFRRTPRAPELLGLEMQSKGPQPPRRLLDLMNSVAPPALQ
jgi:hypothetical protein